MKNEKSLSKWPIAYYALWALSLTNKAWENITICQIKTEFTEKKKIQKLVNQKFS